MPKLELCFIGATRGVTGSLHLVKVGQLQILMDCGLIQGNSKAEASNREPFPFDPKEIDAVILSHAHIDHSGRIPLLVKAGFTGPVYTHRATRDLCKIMLEDSAHIQEKDAEWDNRKRERKGLPLIEALYSIDDAKTALHQFKVLDYDKKRKFWQACNYACVMPATYWAPPMSSSGWKTKVFSARSYSVGIWAIAARRFCATPAILKKPTSC